MPFLVILACWLSASPHAGQPTKPNNTLLQRATAITTFSKNDKLFFGYQWISPTEVGFQRKGGYIRRDVVTGVERAVKGCPEQDKDHWFGGNLGASFTKNGVWMLWNGARGNDGLNDGSLRVERTDGSKLLTWPEDRFPEIAAERAYWLSDNETWACPTIRRDRRPSYVSGIVIGSVRAPGKVRRIPLGNNLPDRWEVIATGRDRLIVVSISPEFKPPAQSSVRITEIILANTVRRGRSFTVRFDSPMYPFCEDSSLADGTTIWSLVVNGDPWHGRRPLTTTVAVLRPKTHRFVELGSITTRENGDPVNCMYEPSDIQWLPDGKRFSFLYGRTLYVASIDQAASNPSTVRMTYDQRVSSYACVRVRIGGTHLEMVLDTGAASSWLRSDAFKSVFKRVDGTTSGSRFAIANASLGQYSRREVYRELSVKNAPLGLLGSSFFDVSQSSKADTHRSPARLALDFVNQTVSIDNRPDRKPYAPSADTISVPMRRYRHTAVRVVSVSIDGGEKVDFVLDTASPVVYLPRKLIDKTPDSWDGVPASVALKIGGKTLNAEACPNFHPGRDYGVPLLGCSILSRFYVVIDYRDNMLYLAPPLKVKPGAR